MPLSLHFDIGHSSIGWAIYEPTTETFPDHLATGVVTFPADDCLVSQRRALRRTRRNIRSTRQRIEQLKRWLDHCSVLTRKELDQPGHAAPFLLAAAALTGVRTLTALELWHCLRWYAHNRGYDGNSRWSRLDAEDSEDTEKVKNAKEQLSEHGKATMAETVCAILKLDPSEVDRKISSFLPYKTLNTAFPREVVTSEVQRLLDLHAGQLPGLDEKAATLIFPNRDLTKPEREQLTKADIKLPKRYRGGLLFGQLVPRFDNRIISRCPITWVKIYREEMSKGSTEDKAKEKAERNAKVPTKKSIEFREYRLARILANLKTDGEPISSEARNDIFDLAKTQGCLTDKDLDHIIAEHHGETQTNVQAYFQLHPDSKDALVFDPIMQELQKARGTRAKLSPFWKFLPARAEADALNLWKSGKAVTLQWIVDQVHSTEHEADLEATIETQFKKARKNYADIGDYCQLLSVLPDWPSGRAPYARPILKQVVGEVLAGHDPTKPCLKTYPERGEDKPNDGILYENSVPNSELNQLLQKRPLDKLTNNALVRHRLLILERLVAELVAEFAPNDPKSITDITVEVAREVKDFSGKSAKEIQSELNGRLRNFKSAVEKLENDVPHLPITGGLIRKCRIAMDMNWTCPFTGDRYEPTHLHKLELEHIIPYSARKTNALHALVLTWPEINRWKGNRTARQFILDEAGSKVPNREKLSILAEKPYLQLIEKLDTKGHPDDQHRKRARKKLLAITHFEEKDQGFTEGALTQSSHLIKLAMRGLKKQLRELGQDQVRIHSLPGRATAEVRKYWDLLGCLGDPEVCGNDAMRWRERRDRQTGRLITENFEHFPALTSPDATDKKATKTAEPCPNDDCEAPLSWPDSSSISEAHCPNCHAILKRVPKPKDDIRSLTHLHHAIDAITLGLITHSFNLTKYGKDQSGRIWEALITRSPNRQQQDLLLETGLFKKHETTDPENPAKTRTRFILKKLPAGLKNHITRHLANARVVQHVPANQSGAKAELMTWGITHIEGDGDDARITLHQSTSKVEKNRRVRSPKAREERAGKLLGPQPKNGKGKLKEIKGALIINENYGLALDPKPEVIPFHQVPQRLAALREANGGRPPRVLRNGMLIKVGQDSQPWQIRSIQNSKRKGYLLDLARPKMIPYREPGKLWCKRDASLSSLLKKGLVIFPKTYSGALRD